MRKRGTAHFPSQLLEEREDARLDRNVERGRRLVENDEGGFGGKGAGEGDALLFAPGKLVRAAPVERLAETHRGQHRGGASTGLFARGAGKAQRAAHKVEDVFLRIERARRILEDDLDRAAEMAKCVGAELEYLLAGKDDPTLALRLEAEDGAGERRLAQPLSPTIASTRSGQRAKETSFTACTTVAPIGPMIPLR